MKSIIIFICALGLSLAAIGQKPLKQEEVVGHDELIKRFYISTDKLTKNGQEIWGDVQGRKTHYVTLTEDGILVVTLPIMLAQHEEGYWGRYPEGAIEVTLTMKKNIYGKEIREDGKRIYIEYRKPEDSFVFSHYDLAQLDGGTWGKIKPYLTFESAGVWRKKAQDEI